MNETPAEAQQDGSANMIEEADNEDVAMKTDPDPLSPVDLKDEVEPKEEEEKFVGEALERFAIVPPRGRARIEDLKGCYEAYAAKGLLKEPDESKPTSLALWRAAVARMEKAVQDQASPNVEAAGGVGTVKPEAAQEPEVEKPLDAVQPEAVQGEEEGEAMDCAEYDPSEVAATLPPAVTHAQAPVEAPPAHAQAQQQEPLAPSVDGLYDLGSDDMEITMPLFPPPQSPVAAPTQLPTPPVTQPVAPFSPAAATGAPPPSSPSSPSSPLPPPSTSPTSPLPAPPTAQPSPSTAAAGPTEAVPHPGSRHLWAGYLASDVSESQLREAFSAFGPLEALRMLRKPGNTTALGFIHFRNTADAVACKEGLDGSTSHLGRAIKLQYQERGNYERCATLRLHNIAPAASESDLKRVFETYGVVRNVHINTRTYIGFVTFEREEEATTALNAIHDTEIMGHHVFMDYAAKDRETRLNAREEKGAPSRGPPPRRDADRRGPEPPSTRPPPQSQSQRLITLSSPPGCPPLEVYGDQNLPMLREMVDLLQLRLPPNQRQTLEQALQNRELYDNINQLVGRNNRDLTGALQTLRGDVTDGGPRGRGRDRSKDRGGRRDGGYPSRDQGRSPPRDDRRGPPRGPPPRDDRDRTPYDGPYGGGGYNNNGGSGYRDGPPPPGRYDDRGHDYYDANRVGPRDHRGPPGGYDSSRGAPPPRDHYEGSERPRNKGVPLREGSGQPREPAPRVPPVEPYPDRRSYSAPRNGGDDVYGGRGRDPPPPPHTQPPPAHDNRWDNRPDDRGRGPPRRRSRSPSPSRKRARAGPPDHGGRPYDGPPRGRSRSRSPVRRRDDPPPLPRDPNPYAAPGGYRPPPLHHAPPPHPPPRQAPPAPLEAECEQFLQSMMGPPPPGPPTYAAPPQAPTYPPPYGEPPQHQHQHQHYPPPSLPAPPPYAAPHPAPSAPAPAPKQPRIWLTSTEAASYACYETVLTMIKDILMPFYRDQRITKEDFKRAAEETTLKIVQQLVDVGLESRTDVPPHYRQVAYDAVRASLKI